MREITIDIKEIYHGFLERKCTLNVCRKASKENKTVYYVEITEDNGVNYLVLLGS